MKNSKLMCALACGVGLTLLAACSSDSKKSSASPGAVSDKSCCTDKSSGQCTDKAAAPAGGSMGTVSEKSGCCSGDAHKTN